MRNRRWTALSLLGLLLLLLMTGGVFAQDTQPSITIDAPLTGDVVDPTLVTVSGTGTALPENNVVVQAVSADGVIFGQEVTTAAAELGGSGPWQVELRLRVAPGTVGQIVAFSQSPESGEPVATAAVDVTFGGDVEPELPVAPTEEPEPELPVAPTEEPEPELPIAPTEEPEPELPIAPTASPASLTIDDPLEGEIVGSVEVVVAGTGQALPENNVVIRALTNDGDLVGEGVATVDAPLGGSGAWSTTIDVTVDPGTAGRIVALAPSPADGSIVAQAAVQVVYGTTPVEPTPTAEPTAEPIPTAEPTVPPVDADISIEIPLDDEIVSAQEVVVVGTGVGLPENNVVVRALDGDGNVLAQAATIVDADLGGQGEWRATLRYTVDGGTAGSIVAFSPSPADGLDVARDEVAVQYGEAQPVRPEISIDRPTANSYVNTDQGFTAGGTAFGTFENNVVVEVYDETGVRLVRQAATADADGRWSAVLNPGQVVGRGVVRAFATSPATGRLDAEDKVSVNFVATVVPEPPSIRIDDPAAGARVNATDGFTVSGVATNVFEGNVIVRLRDGFGRTLRQAVTTADADGRWSVFFRLLIEDGAPGSVYAFSTSPADGSVTADDVVRITFSTPCELESDWPVYVVRSGDTLFSIAQRTGSSVGELMIANCLSNPNLIVVGQRLHVPRLPGAITPPAVTPAIAVESPDADANLPLYAPLTVSGTATGTVPGNLLVRLLNEDGAVLAEERAEIVEITPDGLVWQWEAEVATTRAFTGDRGKLFVYTASLSDGSPELVEQIPVIFGETQTRPYVTIDSPLAYAHVDGEDDVVISGRGGALFENNVVVRIEDNRGNVLVEEPTIMQTEEIGGEGLWEIMLPVDYLGRGRIVALSPSPAEGTLEPASTPHAAIDVVFGDPTELDNYVLITYPLPETLVSNEHEYYAMAGYAGEALVDRVTVLVQDELGNILYLLPAEVDEESGFWSTSIKLDREITRDQLITVNVLASSTLDGSIVAGDRIGVNARAEQAYVTGAVVLPTDEPLPPTANVRVQLLDVSRADVAASVLGEQSFTRGGSTPIPFAVSYDPAEIDPRFTYAVQATVTSADGVLLYRNTTSVRVITGNNPDEDVLVEVEAMQ